ncbi:MAG: hypothetical protein ABIP51_10000 [Bacteroidia bacterium]
MPKDTKIIVVLFFILVLFTCCKKYPEGPFFSLRTSLNRLAGYYVLDKYIVNDIDSTDLIPPCNNLNNLNYTSADGRYYFQFDRHDNIKGIDGIGNYILVAHKNKIDISYNSGLNYFFPFTQGRNLLEPIKGFAGEWEIRKLSNKEFWIKETAGNLTFEVRLRKIHKL